MNYIMIKGQKISLTDEQVERITAAYKVNEIELATIPEGKTCVIGNKECIVLEHCCGETLLLMKDLLVDNIEFGTNNNYNGSNIDEICNKFADELADTVREENVLKHVVDLTSDDGLKDYGEIERRASVFTTEQYRKYVTILDKHKLDKWWWLATPHNTVTHKNANWVKCVSPSGFIGISDFYGYCGVRPFCILKSNIFVSK